MERLQKAPRVVGLKQSEKAIRQGKAEQAFLAEDTDLWMAEAFLALCKEHRVPVMRVSSKKSLAKVCRVEVETACAVLLRVADKTTR